MPTAWQLPYSPPALPWGYGAAPVTTSLAGLLDHSENEPGGRMKWRSTFRNAVFSNRAEVKR